MLRVVDAGVFCGKSDGGRRSHPGDREGTGIRTRTGLKRGKI